MDKNQEMIDRLSRMYAEEHPPVGIKDPVLHKNAIYLNAQLFADFMKWFSDKYVIAEKAKVVNAYNQCKKYSDDNIDAGLESYDVCMTLQGLFGTEIFNEDNE